MKVLKTALIIIMALILIVAVGVYALLAVMNRRNTNYWKYIFTGFPAEITRS